MRQRHHGNAAIAIDDLPFAVPLDMDDSCDEYDAVADQITTWFNDQSWAVIGVRKNLAKTFGDVLDVNINRLWGPRRATLRL